MLKERLLTIWTFVTVIVKDAPLVRNCQKVDWYLIIQNITYAVSCKDDPSAISSSSNESTVLTRAKSVPAAAFTEAT